MSESQGIPSDDTVFHRALTGIVIGVIGFVLMWWFLIAGLVVIGIGTGLTLYNQGRQIGTRDELRRQILEESGRP